MKSEAHVKHKLSQVRFRHLKREVRTGLSRRPSNCRHNGVVELPIFGQTGICLLKTEGRERVLCDSGLNDRAPTCTTFDCMHTKDSLKSEFDEFLLVSDRAHVAERYPDMAALLWVLDLEAPETLTPEDPSVPSESISEPPEPPADLSEPGSDLPSPPLALAPLSNDEVMSSAIEMFWLSVVHWFGSFFARFRRG